jgi:hypothetical protein
MINLKAIKTVYSYYLPEVREAIDTLAVEFPHSTFLKSTTGKGLDEFEQPVIEKFVKFQSKALKGIEKFPYRYWTAGSEEGIREYMSWMASADKPPVVLGIRGEYEGYKAVAESRGLTYADYVPYHSWSNSTLFLSNPSARDGNIIPNAEVSSMANAQKVFYDLSYLGSTEFHEFDLTHNNIDAVAVSFSKPYGLFYYRIGMLFSKHEIPSLYGNRWFKNVFSIMVADRVMDELVSPMVVPQRYKVLQQEIVRDINDRYSLGLHCSNSFLLACRPKGDDLNEEQQDALAPFDRGAGYRLCLTRYYEELERINLSK